MSCAHMLLYAKRSGLRRMRNSRPPLHYEDMIEYHRSDSQDTNPANDESAASLHTNTAKIAEREITSQTA